MPRNSTDVDKPAVLVLELNTKNIIGQLMHMKAGMKAYKSA